MMIDWVHFTPGQSLLGGAMIGAAAALLWLGIGRIAGISGILSGALHRQRGDLGWRLAFLAGLLLAPWLARLALVPVHPRIDASWPMLAGAGLLVGFGTRMGGGCTSGHGVCGLARLSPRSLAAVVTFMAAGFATVYLLRHGTP